MSSKHAHVTCQAQASAGQLVTCVKALDLTHFKLYLQQFQLLWQSFNSCTVSVHGTCRDSTFGNMSLLYQPDSAT